MSLSSVDRSVSSTSTASHNARMPLFELHGCDDCELQTLNLVAAVDLAKITCSREDRSSSGLENLSVEARVVGNFRSQNLEERADITFHLPRSQYLHTIGVVPSIQNPSAPLQSLHSTSFSCYYYREVSL